MAGRPDSEEALVALLRLAQHKNLHPKLSFVASGSKEKYPCKDMHNVVLRIIREFGAQRCVWGSAYPSGLWTPGVSYSQHLRIFSQDLPLKDAERRDVLGETARRLYFPKMAAG
jgi:predicted TIM-barrel fold metal-dependent hydrolase